MLTVAGAVQLLGYEFACSLHSHSIHPVLVVSLNTACAPFDFSLMQSKILRIPSTNPFESVGTKCLTILALESACIRTPML